MSTTPAAPAPRALGSLVRSAGLGFGASALGAAAVGGWVAGGLGAALGLAVPVALALVSLPSLGEHGQPTLGPANAITLVRAVLVAGTAACLGPAVGAGLSDGAVWGLAVASCAAFWLDWVDGRVARATGSASPFGARLDMELDAITILVLCGLVWQLGRAGPWVLASGAMRYAFVAAGWLWPALNRPLFPSRRRAFVCGVQVVCLVGALPPRPWPVAGLSSAVSAFGLIALTASFAIDTAWLIAQARRTTP